MARIYSLNHMDKRIIVIAVFFILISCSSYTRQNNTSADIDDSNVNTIKPLSSFEKQLTVNNFISNINYIVPRIDKLIKIDNLIVEDDRIFLIDDSLNYEVYCINFDGKHLYTISNYGGAENEYYNISNVIVDNNIIEIFDIQRQKKLVFDIINGKWIRSTSFEYDNDIKDLEKFKDRYFIYHANTSFGQSKSFNYHVVDSNFTTIDKYLEINENLKNYTFDVKSSVYKHDKSIYFKELFNDTIYKLDQNGKISSFLYVDFQDRALPSNIKYNSKNTDIGPYITKYTFKGDYIFGIRKMVINDDLFFLDYFDKNKLNHLYYNYQTNKSISYRYLKINDNHKLIGSPEYSFKDSFVSVIDVEKVLAFKNQKEYSELVETLLMQYPNYNIKSNPVIVTYKVNLK